MATTAVKIKPLRVPLVFTERAKYTVYFECNLEESGYVILNMPIHNWQEMGEPRTITATIKP